MSREKFILQARTWIGTKFCLHGRSKRNNIDLGGCDCAGLIIGVLKESIENFDERFDGFIDSRIYKRIISDYELLLNIEKFFKKKKLSDIESGDIALFSFRENLPPQHIGIIGRQNGYFTLIHSYQKLGCVVEHILDDYWKDFLYDLYCV